MEKDEFNRLLATSRIVLNEIESDSIQKDTEDILKFFDKIGSVTVETGEKAFHPVDIPEKLREDSAADRREIENVFENGDTYRFYFLGPKV
ncbi:hypothetical protein M1112_00100 [Candidatus Parvarchaeota archaeon]|jgi:aspartyl/glutamyl-tRNA(Asn/Gln) amidotransferase C subunit|nr:hypothetical protein [Candidatus Parvarchaeota archaeon]